MTWIGCLPALKDCTFNFIYRSKDRRLDVHGCSGLAVRSGDPDGFAIDLRYGEPVAREKSYDVRRFVEYGHPLLLV